MTTKEAASLIDFVQNHKGENTFVHQNHDVFENGWEKYLEKALSCLKNAYQLEPNDELREKLDSLEFVFRDAKPACVQREDLECAMCFRLFYQPVTTPCGHTFCRSCVFKILDFAQCCPICRESLHISDDHPINVTLQNLVEKYFPEDVKMRKLEEKQMQYDVVHTTPLFVINSQCFPGQEFNLHIFEPRYRLMLKRVLAGQRQFGLVNCLQNQQGAWEMCSVGVNMNIIRVESMADGTSVITTKATRRFKILEQWDLDGYKMGKIEFIDDLAKDSNETIKENELADRIKYAINQMIAPGYYTSCEGMQKIATVIKEHIGSMPNSLEDLSWWLVSILPVGAGIKAAFLSTTSCMQRLQMLLNILATNPHQGGQPPQSQCTIS